MRVYAKQRKKKRLPKSVGLPSFCCEKMHQAWADGVVGIGLQLRITQDVPGVYKTAMLDGESVYPVLLQLCPFCTQRIEIVMVHTKREAKRLRTAAEKKSPYKEYRAAERAHLCGLVPVVH